ncbi:MAG TPA: hypothetical protein VG164_14240 [Trebonia sp.]|nr:hypothetical protein [Trebonia sp.]
MARVVARVVARGVWRLLRLAGLAALTVAFAPVTLVAAGTAAAGWWRGWPPRRLYAAAAWCLPMAAVWLLAIACWPGNDSRWPGNSGRWPDAGGRWPPGLGAGPAWQRVVAAPYRAWLAMWQLGAHGHVAAAAVAVAAPAIPLGILLGARAWAIRLHRMETGSGGRSPAAPARFDARLWRRQVRSAKALMSAPAALPVLSPNGAILTGATIRTVRHRAGRAAAIPYERLRSHQVVIGTTGTGKTTLLLRLWAGFMAGGLRRYAAGAAGRPLLVVLDCKGGASSRKVADRARRVLRDAGARSTAIWPDEAALSLWSLPPDRLVTTLLDLIEHGTGGAAYYTDVMETLVALAVTAPCGPPAGAADFQSRLDADWLLMAYAGRPPAPVAHSRQAIADVALRFSALWRRLGPGLDGTGTFDDADCWYCVLEGTAEPSVAEAQARALTDLLASYAVLGGREILLAVDEFSAVARRLPIWRLYERARSLGLAIQVSAQSWEGLAGTEDERNRVAATAEGGIWLLRTPRPEPVADLAGGRVLVDTSRRLAAAGTWEAAGSSRQVRVPVLDGDLVRRLDVGQVAYIYRGGVTYVQVKRLVGTQAALAAVSVPAGAEVAGRVAGADAVADTVPLPRVGTGPAGAGPAGAAPVPPDAGEVLDAAFGARRG